MMKIGSAWIGMCLTVAASFGFATGRVLANDDEYDDRNGIPYDFDSNQFWDHFDIDEDSLIDTWDVNEDRWIDMWDVNNTGSYVTFAVLASTWNAHVGLVCFADSTSSCNCKLQLSSNWTCYINASKSECYDENSVSNVNLNKAETCKSGKIAKRYQTC